MLDQYILDHIQKLGKWLNQLERTDAYGFDSYWEMVDTCKSKPLESYFEGLIEKGELNMDRFSPPQEHAIIINDRYQLTNACNNIAKLESMGLFSTSIAASRFNPYGLKIMHRILEDEDWSLRAQFYGIYMYIKQEEYRAGLHRLLKTYES